MEKRNLTELQEIEQSLITTYRKSIWSRFIKGIQEFKMINEGDKIAVCMSGGKDSALLAKCMQELKKHSKVKFDIVFLIMDPGYNEKNRNQILLNLKRLNIPAEIFDSNIFDIVDTRPDHQCFLCARMRRGCLYGKAQELGCNKIALGHHFDDVIETALMGMFYGAQFETMMPKLHSTNHKGMELIRPLYFVREEDIIKWRDKFNLVFLNCACKVTSRQEGSKRLEIKNLLKELRKTNERIDMNIYNSTKNVNIGQLLGFVDNGKKYYFMDDYEEKN